MSCCPTIDNVFAGTPIVYGVSQNVNISAEGVITRNGGVDGSSDAFAEGANWVDGEGCAAWVWTIFNDVDDHESNLINYYIVPEDPVTGVDGWGFTNQFVSFRRGQFLNSVGGGLIYYRNMNLGFNHFAIIYNNGTVYLYETADNATEDPGWILPQSYSRTGLPTTTRYRLHVTVKPALNARSSPVLEFIGVQGDVCTTAAWSLPLFQWQASGTTVGPSPPPPIETCSTAEEALQPYPRVQRILDFQQEIHRNIQLQISTIAPLTIYGYSMEWVPVSVSELTEQRNAYGAVWQFTEYGHLFYAYIGHISTMDLELTITVDAGTGAAATDSYTIPNTGGTFRKDWVVLAARKGKLFDLTITSSEEFQIVVEQSVLFGKEFKSSGGYQPLRAFGDHT